LGGDAALASVERDTRFKAAVAVDPPVISAVGTSKPVLILTEGRDQWGTLDCQLWQRLSGPRLLVNFRGAEHDTPSDAVWLGNSVPVFQVETGTMGPEKMTTAIRSYVTAFLDTYLSGKPSPVLLSRRSTDFTDAVTTTQKQALCGEFVPK
jgi:hypothetical protein